MKELFRGSRGAASDFKHDGCGFDFYSSIFILFISPLWQQDKGRPWISPLNIKYLEIREIRVS